MVGNEGIKHGNDTNWCNVAGRAHMMQVTRHYCRTRPHVYGYMSYVRASLTIVAAHHSNLQLSAYSDALHPALYPVSDIANLKSGHSIACRVIRSYNVTAEQLANLAMP
eukprot:scaffold202222_cov34-Prasinocladus_malaysianus.AAC.2